MRFQRQLPPLCFLESVFRGRDVFARKRFEELDQESVSAFPHAQGDLVEHTTWSLSCQNSFSFALSKNGKFRMWCTNMYRRRGSSESSGATSPASDLKGAPKRLRAVGVFSSDISYFVCCDMSSRLRSVHKLALSYCPPGCLAAYNVLVCLSIWSLLAVPTW